MIRTRDIGFAAFILMLDTAKCIGYEKASREFIIDCPISQSELSISYMNSECRRHDSIVVHLKHLIIGA
jgi:hypothetical protein